ncbi:MAG TPA: deoxyribose-phosphate aldolase [Bacteroidales bacterium]|nr:deoxyribose-phosphate aldolase [Bacteroidales bacterium]
MKKFTFESFPSSDLIKSEIESYKLQIPQNKTKEILLSLLNFIDLTSLNTTDGINKIKNMTEKVNDFPNHFPHYKNVAAICVFPIFVQTVKESLTAKDVNIAAVGASFPSSQTFLSVKAAECELIVHKGADEVDIVISVGSFLENNFQIVANEIEIIKHAMGDAHLKVILETGELLNTDNIFKASIISMESGADFIKTSTGKSSVSATPEAVYTMCYAIKKYYEKTGRKVGIKPSGGMSTSEDALIYYLIVKNVLGEEWLTNKMFRLGASRLANSILTDLNILDGKNEEIKYF